MSVSDGFRNMYSYVILVTVLIVCANSIEISEDVNMFTQMQYSDLFQYIVEAEERKDLCTVHLLEYLLALSEFRPWALKLFDSSSKLHSGLLRGNLFNLGDFDECLSVENPEDTELQGKYCLGTLKLPKIMSKELNETSYIGVDLFEGFTRTGTPKNSITITQAICLPKSCNGSEIAEKISNITADIFKLKIDDDQCQVLEESHLSTVNIFVVAILAIYMAWLIICTTIDFLQEFGSRRLAYESVLQFSLYSNYKKLTFLSVQRRHHMPSLNGFRFWSLMWIIYSHRNFVTASLPSINLVESIEWLSSMKGSIVIGSTITVDTFLILSGFLLSLSFLNYMDRTDGRANWIYFYLHRYIRLTTVYLVIIIFHITLLKEIGSGPFWDRVYTATTEQCNTYWYTAILYVQNYVNPNEICIGHSWYLSVDMQLYCLSPIILYPLWKFKRMGKILYLIVLIAAEIILVVVVYFEKISVNGILQSGQDKLDWTRLYYVPTHTRAVPWLIGVGFGYIMYRLKHCSVRINIILIYLGWLVSLVICSAVVFGINPFIQFNYHYDQLKDTLYLSLGRLGWSIAICWMIFACLTGYGGVISRFLSMPIWQPFCRISYSMYLIHLSFQTYYGASMRAPYYFSCFEMIYKFCGDFVVTAVLALIVTLMFESPVLGLEKMLLTREIRQELPAIRRTPIQRISPEIR